MKNLIRVRAGKKSKTKGNSNERKIALQFKEYWQHGEWARTPASGGWATAAHREAFRTCGDVITTATDFPFCLELKKQEAWRLEQILSTDSKCKIFEWWDQTVGETPKGFVPLLIVSRNFVDPIVIFNGEWFVKEFKQYMKEGDPCYEWQLHPHIYFDHGMLHAVDKPESLFLLTLDNFFKIHPKYFGRKDENVRERENESGTSEAIEQTDNTGTEDSSL